MMTEPETNKEVYEKCVEVCQSLLRGELSAVETYDRAIEKFSGEAFVSELRQVRDSHVSNQQLLREHVTSMNVTPETDPGAWGDFANGVQAAANFFGENSALSSLKAGEKHGENEYADALEENIMADAKELISSSLLPTVRRNQGVLDALKGA